MDGHCAEKTSGGSVIDVSGTRIEVCSRIVSISPVPNSEGPGAPSSWFATVIETGAIRPPTLVMIEL